MASTCVFHRAECVCGATVLFYARERERVVRSIGGGRNTKNRVRVNSLYNIFLEGERGCL